MQFVARPVHVEAWQWDPGSTELPPDWMRDAMRAGRMWIERGGARRLWVRNASDGHGPSDNLVAHPGDWVVRTTITGRLAVVRQAEFPALFASLHGSPRARHGVDA